MLLLVNLGKEPVEFKVTSEKSDGFLSLFKASGFNRWFDTESGTGINPEKIAIEGWGVKMIGAENEK